MDLRVLEEAAFRDALPELRVREEVIATYSGDANNAPVAGECNSTNEIVTVSPVPPPQILSAGPILPATGSSTGVLLIVAFGVTLSGLVLVASTTARRRLVPATARR